MATMNWKQGYFLAACGVAVGILTGCNRADSGTAGAVTDGGKSVPVAVPANVQQHADAARASEAKEAEGAAIRARMQNQK